VGVIHTEAWCKEAGREEELHRLLRDHEAEETLDSATAVWRAYLRLGKLPPIDYKWVQELDEEGEDMPSFKTWERSTHYHAEEVGDDPEDESEWEIFERETSAPLRRTVPEIVEHIREMDRWPFIDVIQFEDYAFDTSVSPKNRYPPFIEVLFRQEPFEDGGDIFQEVWFFIEAPPESAKQLWDWANV